MYRSYYTDSLILLLGERTITDPEKDKEKQVIYTAPRKIGESINYIGKIGLLGSTGSGKTKLIKLLANLANKRIIYNYDETEEVNGTLQAQPYSLPLTNNERVLIIDNPGQNSLASVRTTVAGDSYKGLIIVLDAIGKNFWSLSLQQCDTIIKSVNDPKLPIIIIINKYDLQIALMGWKSFVDDLALLIEKIASSIEYGKKLPYYDRTTNKVEYLPFDSPSNSLSFTQLEQVIVNGLDQHFNINPVSGFTKLNIRLLVRSLLLGYCNLFKSYSVLPEFKAKYPGLSIQDDIQNSLMYFRPTAYENKTSWIKMANNDNAKEPIIPLEYFKYANIATILKKDVIITSEDQITEFINKSGKKYAIWAHYLNNINKRESLEQILEGITKLTESPYFKKEKTGNKKNAVKENGMKLPKSSFKATAPPPKPKRTDWQN